MFRLNLRIKIFASYMILIIILAFISVQAVNSLQRLETISDTVINERYKSVFAAQSMLKTLEQLKNGEEKLALGRTEEADAIFSESVKEFQARLEETKENMSIEGEEKLIRRIEQFFLHYLDQHEYMKAAVEKRNMAKMEFYAQSIQWQLDGLRQHILSLMETNRQEMFEENKKARDLNQSFIGSMIIFSIIGMIIGLGVSIWLTNIVVGPIEKLTAAVSEIRKGNLDISMDTGRADEIGILATEFNKMTERLKVYQQLNLEKLIEEKKRTEAILRSVGDSLIVIDTNYRIILVNPSAERTFYLIPGMSQGREFREIFKSEALFGIIKDGIEKKSKFGRAALPTFEWEYDRVKRHFQVKVFPVEKEDGVRIAYVILLEDVTKLKEIDRMKSDFISIASHELRTPLTSIIMSLGMVTEGAAGPLTEDQKELLNAAKEDASRMSHLMTNLLDISRIEAGRLEMDLLPVAPSVLINKVISTFNIQAQTQGVELVADIAPDLPEVSADYNRVLQVFSNLVGNALRYTPEKGKITLSAVKLEDYVKFTVADTGPGIPKEFRKKIFHKFVQVDDDPKRGGAGLGLALSFEIIKAHHGSIWLDETSNGAVFHFTLPIYLPD